MCNWKGVELQYLAVQKLINSLSLELKKKLMNSLSLELT